MKTWEDLAQIQPLAVKVLTNSIERNRISHAYLIQGMRGTSKSQIALQLAQVLFCEERSGVEPCHTCSACRRIASHNHPDVHFIKPDGQSIKIEQIKHLQKEFTYSGVESNQKAYIIEGADTLTLNAANRILKFLEEPSQKTTAIMLTENGQAMIPTIRSRCQIIDLRPLHPMQFQKQLIDSGMKERDARLISALTNDADEAFRLSEDVEFAQSRKLVVQWIEVLLQNANDLYLYIHQHWLNHFKERKEQDRGLDLLLLAYKDLLYNQIGDGSRMVFFEQSDERLQTMSLRFSREKLLQDMERILHAKRELKQNVHPTLVIEKLALQVKG